MVTVQLEKPIEHGDGTIEAIELRDMRMEDIYKIGYPYTITGVDDDVEIIIKPRIIAKYVSRLGAVPPSVVEKITVKDLNNLQTEVMRFFGQSDTDLKTTSSE